MEVIPALDLLGGRCVRLLKGDYAQETVYSHDPLEVAGRYVRAGCTRLHVVDLDAARGSGHNRELVRRLVTKAGVGVQVAGGIRTPADVESWLELGTVGVIMGTTAVRQPEVLAECAQANPGRVLAALDVRGGRPSVTGWTQAEDVTLDELLEKWEAASLGGVIVTSIDRDGTMEGPDLATLKRVLDFTTHPVIYSGGIGSLDHLRAVAATAAAGVILGKALYETRFDLEDAFEVAS